LDPPLSGPLLHKRVEEREKTRFRGAKRVVVVARCAFQGSWAKNELAKRLERMIW
jgi:hypothetical protein